MIDLDDINLELIDLMQHDARLSYRELGERIGLSAPAIAERVRKLEEAGIIRGYQAAIDYEALGFPLLCIIRLNAPSSDRALDEVIAALPEVIEANRVTGSESHVLRARVRSTKHLEDLLDHLRQHGSSVTNIVTSSPVPRRPMDVRTAIERADELERHQIERERVAAAALDLRH